MSPTSTAMLSALTALVTALLVAYYAQFLKRRSEQAEENKKVNQRYLNPLRLYLEENYFRIDEILRRLKANDQKTKLLLSEKRAADISQQSAEWFNGTGCYLTSTCYFTACLFYQFKEARDNLSYLRLGQDDTELLNLVLKVRLAFLKNLGIYYSTQTSIGTDLYLPEKNRLMTYREFCKHLQDPDRRIWFDRLIEFYVCTGRGENLDRLEDALKAIRELSGFLDKAVGGGPSIPRRYVTQGISLGPHA